MSIIGIIIGILLGICCPLAALLIAARSCNILPENLLRIIPKQSRLPLGYNSVEAGRVYKGKMGHEDVNALLVSLAVKGYIRIVNNRSGELSVVQLKEYDGEDKYEAQFFNSIFDNSTGYFAEDDSIMPNKAATTSDLKDIYRKVGYTIARDVNSDHEKIGIRTARRKNYDKYYCCLSLLATIPVMLLILFTSGINGQNVNMFFSIPFTLVGTNVGIGEFDKRDLRYGNNFDVMQIFIIVFGIVFACAPLEIIFSQMTNIANPYKSILFFIQVFTIIGIIIVKNLSGFSKQRISSLNSFGKKLLKKVSGFTRYLKDMSPAKIEKKVKKDPEFYYEMLPFAVALGQSKEWLEKGREANIDPPAWYSNETDVVDFNQFCNEFNETLQDLEKM